MMKRLLFVFTALLFSTFFLSAQELPADSARYVRIVLNDGTIKEGTLMSIDEEDVVLELGALGATRIPKYMIEIMNELVGFSPSDKDGKGRAYDINPQASRYFFAPSAIQLKEGEGYFQSNIALNSVSMGLSDHLTLGGVMSFLGAGGTIKVGTPLGERLNVSLGGIGFADFYGIFDRPVGMGFVNLSLGDEVKNITVNLGIANKSTRNREVYSGVVTVPGLNGEASSLLPTSVASTYSTRPLIINVSAMTPMTSNRWLVTENYWIQPRSKVNGYAPYQGPAFYYPPFTESDINNEALGIVSLGIRSLNLRTGWLWDYGLVGVFTEGGDGFAAPWVSFTLAF